MSWSDAIKDAVGNLVGEAEQSALPDLVKKVLGNEGLQSILAKLQDAGLQAQVSLGSRYSHLLRRARCPCRRSGAPSRALCHALA